VNSLTLACPECDEGLVADIEDSFRCPEGHPYAVVDLALTTNTAALQALWMAIRALEDDACSLKYMAAHYGDAMGMSAAHRNAEAEAALEAATILRGHAKRAQEKLDALTSAHSAGQEQGSTSGRGD
jgi:hypothetical protein